MSTLLPPRANRLPVQASPHQLAACFDSEADEAQRAQLIARNIFPGSSEKKPIRIELRDGREITGFVQVIHAPFVRVWSLQNGIVEIQVSDLPDELACCFRGDALFDMRQQLAKARESYVDTVAEMQRHLAIFEDLSETVEQATGFTVETMEQAGATVDAAAAEIAALKATIDGNSAAFAEIEQNTAQAMVETGQIIERLTRECLVLQSENQRLRLALEKP
jgi:hypothetical protein